MKHINSVKARLIMKYNVYLLAELIQGSTIFTYWYVVYHNAALFPLYVTAGTMYVQMSCTVHL